MPEVTDFLSGGLYEWWDNESNRVLSEKTAVPFTVRLSSISSRYIIFSYGLTDGTHDVPFGIVYDSALKRFGKLATPHVQIFELVSDTGADGLTWTESAPNEWEDYPVAWSSLVTFSNSTPKAKNTIGVLKNDGSIEYVNFSLSDESANGIIVLGKFQLTRTSLVRLEEILVECTGMTENANFECHVWTTDSDGRTILNPAPQVSLYSSNPDVRRFDTHTTGVNHSVIFKGSFNLISYILTLVQDGHR